MSEPDAPERRRPHRSTSGIEIEPVYGPRTSTASIRPTALGEPGAFPYTRGIHPDGYRGRPWTMRQYAGFGSAEETNRRFRYLLERGQTGLSVAFDLPTQMGYDSDDPMVARRGGPRRRADRLDRRHGAPARRDRPRRRSRTSMTINATAAILLTLYETVARRRGVDPRAPAGHDPERHPQGVHRARDLHLPARAVDAAGDRHVRLLPGRAAGLEHDQHQRLPHARGRRDGGPGGRLHGRQCHRLRRRGPRRRPGLRRVRAAPLVLLRRPQRPPRGGREVPRRPPRVGHGRTRAVRRDAIRRAWPCASTSRPAARRSPPSSRT